MNEDPTLKREASLQRFLRKKQKNFLNEIEHDKSYPFGSAPTRIYDTRKMHKFSSSDSFPKLHPIVSSIGTFNYNFAHFLCDLISPLVPNNCSSLPNRRVARNKSGGGKDEPLSVSAAPGISMVAGKMSHL